jgi:hypothetical protein
VEHDTHNAVPSIADRKRFSYTMDPGVFYTLRRNSMRRLDPCHSMVSSVSVLDPDSVGSADPDPDWDSRPKLLMFEEPERPL